MRRLKWWMYRLCWRLGMKDAACFFLFSGRLTPAQEQYGRELWERIKPKEQT